MKSFFRQGADSSIRNRKARPAEKGSRKREKRRSREY
jgi:hypothetical protein